MLSVVDQGREPLAVIFGLSGQKLTQDETRFFKDSDPLGFILFKRNIDTPEQVRNLVSALKDTMGRDVPVLIDQEGARVQRLGPPHWPEYPPAREFGDSFRRDFTAGRKMLYDSAYAMGADLHDLGITVDCAPVMDVLQPETHDIIGDRAFAGDPKIVSVLGGVVSRALLASGVIPIMKHIPGHGRAIADSHDDLPVVEASLEDLDKTDFDPFRQILAKPFSEAIWAMTAHIIYSDIDERAPATCSRRVIFDIIRERIGFKGLLVSDDLGMAALAQYGDMGARAEMVLRAGCDIALHCDGNMNDMVKIAGRAQKMTNEAVMRYNRSVKWLKRNYKTEAA